MEAKLYVGNLPYTTVDADLENLFSQAGTVKSAQVIKDRVSGRSKGFGFVEMSSPDEAQSAINKFNGQDFNGRALTVNLARPRDRSIGGKTHALKPHSTHRAGAVVQDLDGPVEQMQVDAPRGSGRRSSRPVGKHRRHLLSPPVAFAARARQRPQHAGVDAAGVARPRKTGPGRGGGHFVAGRIEALDAGGGGVAGRTGARVDQEAHVVAEPLPVIGQL